MASLSLPIGAVVLAAFAGISGATATSIAVGRDGFISTMAARVSPYVPLIGSDETPNGLAANSATPAHTPSGRPAGSAAATTQASGNRPTIATAAGVISSLGGGSFVLTNGANVTHVNIDGLTAISGVIADGATVTVSGDITAEKNLHATTVDVADNAPGTEAAVTSTPGSAVAPANTPQADTSRTPTNPHASTTPDPGAEATPPGASGDHKPHNDGHGGYKP